MDTMVVSTSEICFDLYSKRKVKCLALDRLQKFRTQNRFRTNQEIDDCMLPLPSLRGVRGEPEYMVILYL